MLKIIQNRRVITELVEAQRNRKELESAAADPELFTDLSPDEQTEFRQGMKEFAAKEQSYEVKRAIYGSEPYIEKL